MTLTGMLPGIDFTDLDNFAHGFPHELFAIHRRAALVYVVRADRQRQYLCGKACGAKGPGDTFVGGLWSVNVWREAVERSDDCGPGAQYDGCLVAFENSVTCELWADTADDPPCRG